MAKIFISYASENRDIAQDIFYALSKKGMDVSLDEKSLKTGDEYHAKLRELILSSDYFIFLISQYSISDNSYCLTELKFAEQKWAKDERGFIPVMIETVENSKLPALLRQSNYMRPKGNVTAEVTSEILSQEQGINTDEIELITKEREVFAREYFNNVLNQRLKWLRSMAYTNKKRLKIYNLALVFTSCGIIIAQVLTESTGIHPDYIRIISSLLAIYALVYAVLVAQEPWKWKIYQMQAEKMESEYRRFVTMTTPYSIGLGEARSKELFVENIEQIIDDNK